MTEMLRAPAEVKYAEELDWLESIDDGPKPFSWRLSPPSRARPMRCDLQNRFAVKSSFRR